MTRCFLAREAILTTVLRTKIRANLDFYNNSASSTGASQGRLRATAKDVSHSAKDINVHVRASPRCRTRTKLDKRTMVYFATRIKLTATE